MNQSNPHVPVIFYTVCNALEKFNDVRFAGRDLVIFTVELTSGLTLKTRNSIMTKMEVKRSRRDTPLYQMYWLQGCWVRLVNDAKGAQKKYQCWIIKNT